MVPASAWRANLKRDEQTVERERRITSDLKSTVSGRRHVIQLGVEMVRAEIRPKRKFVTQCEANDCVVATVAIAAGLPYEKILDLRPRDSWRCGLYPNDVRYMLRMATNSCRRFYRPLSSISFVKLCNKYDKLVLFIRPPGNVFLQRIKGVLNHCIFVEHGWVFDPSFSSALRIDDYERIDWIPTMSLFPVFDKPPKSTTLT